MTISYSLAPNPHWVIIDNFDDLPPFAAIYTYSSLNPSVFKPAYQDAGGNIPWGQPIVGFGNGTMPPIFWKFDSDNPSDLYYIQVWSGVQTPGGTAVMLWDFNGLTGGGSGGGGGGGTITTNLDLENLVINGEFYHNVGNSSGSSVATQVTLAPSSHVGFCGIGAPGTGAPAPDIIFAKGDQSASDAITFTNFTAGDSFFSPAPTPQQFVNYTCSVAGSEAFKFIQFPIIRGLQNINNVNISVQMWNRLNSGNTNITLNLRQFFGNGTNGPSGDVLTSMGALNLTTSTWTKTQITSFLVPSIASKTIGNCGNDALFLQIGFPSSVLINLDFILPALYLGNTNSAVDFHTTDFVDAIVNSPRTGDIRTSLNSFYPYGWVPMNDGTIGSANSNATTRANIDTFALFDLIWRTFQGNQTLAPMLTSASAPAAYGANSWTDFGNNNQITLTVQAGRVIAGVSGSHLIGTIGGSDTHTNTIGEMAAHTHTYNQTVAGGSFLAGGGASSELSSSTGSTGGGSAWDIRQPTVYQNIFIKL